MQKPRYELVNDYSKPVDFTSHVIDHKSGKIVMQGTERECVRWLQETVSMRERG